MLLTRCTNYLSKEYNDRVKVFSELVITLCINEGRVEN